MAGVSLSADGEIRQCWYDKISAVAFFPLHLELHPLLLENNN
jgi:hypothetical protein